MFNKVVKVIEWATMVVGAIAASFALTTVILFVIAVVVSEKPEDFESFAPTFVEVERNYSQTWRIYYHQDTKVMYAVSKDGVWTVMVNADGSPMIWEG